VLGVPASALLDQRVDATDVFARAAAVGGGAVDIVAVIDGLGEGRFLAGGRQRCWSRP